MKLIENQEFGGERPLFALTDTVMKNVTIHAGESSLKHTKNVRAEGCRLRASTPSGTPIILKLITASLRRAAARRCGTANTS